MPSCGALCPSEAVANTQPDSKFTASQEGVCKEILRGKLSEGAVLLDKQRQHQQPRRDTLQVQADSTSMQAETAPAETAPAAPTAPAEADLLTQKPQGQPRRDTLQVQR